MSDFDMDDFDGEAGYRHIELSRGLPDDDRVPAETDEEREASRLYQGIGLCLNRAGLGATWRLINPLMDYFTAAKRSRPTLAALAASLRWDTERTREIVDAIDRFRGNA